MKRKKLREVSQQPSQSSEGVCQIQGANSGVDNRTSGIRWSVPRRYTYTTPDQVIS